MRRAVRGVSNARLVTDGDVCPLSSWQVETYFYDIRKQLYDYDNVLNQQREKLYSERKRAMMAENLEGLMVRRGPNALGACLRATRDCEPVHAMRSAASRAHILLLMSRASLMKRHRFIRRSACHLRGSAPVNSHT
jgi:hypothetical protein